MKRIKGIIFKHDNTEYFYTGMRSDLRGFLNLHQGGMNLMEYHGHWTTGKDLEEKFKYKIKESILVTDREC